MALQAEIVTFNLRTGLGSQTIPLVTYPSLTPKAIIFISAAIADGSNASYTYGFDDGTTHLGTSVGLGSQFGVCLSARQLDTEYSMSWITTSAFFGGAIPRVRAYVSAINVGSFTITVDVNQLPGSGWRAIVIGGDNVECAVGIYDISAGSGTVNVGFDPVALLKLSTLDTGSSVEVAGAYQSYGFGTLCGSDDQVGWGVAASSNTSACTSFQIDGVIQEDIVSSGTTISDPVTIAFVSNGFTVTVSGGPDFNIGYLAIGGDAVSANLVSITQPTSTGVQNTTITATNPVLALFSSTCKIATAGSGSVDANLAFGAYDGVTNISSWWGGINGATSPFKRDAKNSSTTCISLRTATGAPANTINADATCTLSSGNIALNWTTADATQRQVWALVLAQNLTGSFSACGANPQGSITVIKQTAPFPGGQTDFPFGTTGGLSPSTFLLQDGQSQLFSGLSAGTYGVTEVEPDGWVATYSVSDGSPHDAIVLSSGEAVTVTVTNTFQSSTSQMRVYRRFRLPWDGNKRIFIPRIEIVAQMGVGNAADTDPVMSMRISPDGGVNWGPFRDMPLGSSSEPQIRAYLTRFCQGMRNPVAELICDAPVFVGWIACELPQDFTVGTS
jgi:hypothetical protein